METVQAGELFFQPHRVKHVYPYGNWLPWKTRDYRRVPKGTYAVLICLGLEGGEQDDLDIDAAIQQLAERVTERKNGS